MERAMNYSSREASVMIWKPRPWRYGVLLLQLLVYWLKISVTNAEIKFKIAKPNKKTKIWSHSGWLSVVSSAQVKHLTDNLATLHSIFSPQRRHFMLILGKSIFNNWSGFGFGLQSFHHIQRHQGNTHEWFPREDLQQRDQVMSIPEIFVQVAHVTLWLSRQKHAIRILQAMSEKCTSKPQLCTTLQRDYQS